MGGGITGAKGNPDSNLALEKMATDYFNMAKPLLQHATGGADAIIGAGPGQFADLSQSFQDALRTGATHAYQPAINRATEASLKAGSQATDKAREDWTRQGVTGTDYDRLLSQAMNQSNFQASQAPAELYKSQADAASSFGYGQATQNQNFYRDVLATFYKTLAGAPATGLQGQAAAATNETNVNTTNVRAATDMINEFTKSAGSIGAAGAMGCWLAARLFGRQSPEFYLARWWIFTRWQGPLAWLVRQLYLRYGERLTHPLALRLLKPFLVWAVTQGRRTLYG